MSIKTGCKLSQAMLEKFKVIISDKINTTQFRLDELSDALTMLGEGTADTTVKSYEDGSEVSEQESLSRLAERQKKLLTQLERAMERINDGTYGTCVLTGELIPISRLMVVPHTEYSVEAKLQGSSFMPLKKSK